MSSPLITTIIPTYRRPEMLRRAVLSVLNQTFSDLQVCVYDNASGDETAQVITELIAKDPRVKYFQRASNIGSIENFNDAMRCINTPFFSLLSDDDYLLPNFYQHGLEKLCLYPDAMFFAGAVLYMASEGDIISISQDSWSRQGFFGPQSALTEMFNHNHPILTGMLFRSEIINSCGTFSLATKIPDLHYEFLAASLHSCVTSTERCGVFIKHAESAGQMSGAYDFWKSYVDLVGIIDNDQRFPNVAQKLIVTELKRYVNYIGTRMCISCTLKQDYTNAQNFAESIHIDLKRTPIFYLLKSLIFVCQHSKFMLNIAKMALAVKKSFKSTI